MNPRNLFLSLILGSIIGSLAYAFFYWIQWAENLRNQYPQIVLAMPIILILIFLTIKKTFYFPKKVIELHEAQERQNHRPLFWNRFTSVYQLVGAGLSHLVGASVGREGAVVVMATGLSTAFKLNLQYWAPVLAAAGFATGVGKPFIAVLFIVEMYRTHIAQKLWSLIIAWVAVLSVETLNLYFTPDASFIHLLPKLTIEASTSIWNRLFFVIAVGVLMGLISKFYKIVYEKLNVYFKSSKIKVLPVVISLLVAVFLFQNDFQYLQSLSFNLVGQHLNLNINISQVFLKLLITLICVSLGFFGGEFVPLVVVGTGYGLWFSQMIGELPTFGILLGSFGIFCGITRLKWTAIALALSLSGIGYFFWIFICYSLCINFCGEKSIYSPNTTDHN